MGFLAKRISFPDPVITEVLAPFPKDFVIVVSYDDPQILELIIRHPEFPTNTEVITQECSAFFWPKNNTRKVLIKLARKSISRPLLKISSQKHLSLWLGTPLLELSDPVKCYNAYILCENGKIVFWHRKKYLFNKKGVFMEKDVFDAPPVYDGHLEGRTILICHEIQGFYDPVWKRCRLPEVRDDRSRLVIVPAIWTADKKEVLKRITRAVVRRMSDPVDGLSALHSQGSIALVADDSWAGIFGAVTKGRQKGASFAEIRGAGWIHIDRAKSEIKTVEVV